MSNSDEVFNTLAEAGQLLDTHKVPRDKVSTTYDKEKGYGVLFGKDVPQASDPHLIEALQERGFTVGFVDPTCKGCYAKITGFDIDGYCEDGYCEDCGDPLTTDNERAACICDSCA